MGSRRRHGGAGIRRGVRSPRGEDRILTPIDIWGAAAVWYEFTDPYLTYSGPDVTAAQNVANPGTYDLGVGSAPLFVADGLDGRDCGEFDGAGESLLVNTLPLAVGDTWDIYAVVQYMGTPPPGGVEYILYTDNGGGASQVTANWNSDYGMEYRSTPSGYASNRGGALDTDPHLIVAASYNQGSGTSDGNLYIDGSVVAAVSSGQDGTQHGVSRFTVGALPGGASAANMRVSEIVLVRNETNGDANRLAYQERIKALYPTIGAALP